MGVGELRPVPHTPAFAGPCLTLRSERGHADESPTKLSEP